MEGSNRDNARRAAQESERAAALAFATSAASLRILYELHAFFKIWCGALASGCVLLIIRGVSLDVWIAGAIMLSFSAWALRDIIAALRIKIQ
jgi:hypothetical protein